MKDILFTVQHNKQLNGEVFELKLFSDETLPDIVCGQFLHLEVPLKSAILRRPFCIYNWGKNFVTIAVENAGKGTESLSKVEAGQQLKAILPLGNGFYLEDNWKKIALVGGSIGCAPLYGIMTSHPDRQYQSYLGFKSKEHVLFEDDFSKISKTTICTYNGSYGTAGYQIPALEKDLNKFMPDVILACGSKSMVKSVKAFSEKYNIPAFMSNEQRMACGVGACLGCTCKVKNENGDIKNKRVCMDGPVFNLKDMVL